VVVVVDAGGLSPFLGEIWHDSLSLSLPSWRDDSDSIPPEPSFSGWWLVVAAIAPGWLEM